MYKLGPIKVRSDSKFFGDFKTSACLLLNPFLNETQGVRAVKEKDGDSICKIILHRQIKSKNKKLTGCFYVFTD